MITVNREIVIFSILVKLFKNPFSSNSIEHYCYYIVLYVKKHDFLISFRKLFYTVSSRKTPLAAEALGAITAKTLYLDMALPSSGMYAG